MKGFFIDYDLMHALAPPALAGDPVATEELLAEAYRLAGRIVDARGYLVRVGGDRKDLVQAGVIKFASGLRTWDPKRFNCFALFGAYVIERGIIGELRRLNRRKHHPEAFSLDAPLESTRHKGRGGDPVSHTDIPDIRPEADPTAMVLPEADSLLAALRVKNSPMEDRTLMEYILGEMSGKQLAAATGTTAKCVDNAALRVRRKMARVALGLVDDERFTPETRDMLRRAVAGIKRLYPWRKAAGGAAS